MSSQYLDSSTPSRNINIKAHDALFRNDCSVVGTSILRNCQYNGVVSFSQATSATTAVTASDADSFKVVMQSSSNAAGVNTVFNIVKSCGANSHYTISIYDYSGTIQTNGVPTAHISSINPSAGNVQVVIGNAHASNALNGVLTLRIHHERGSTSA